MGVPGFFKWIMTKYKNKEILKYHLMSSTDVLYLDANCLIHPQTRKVLDAYPDLTDREELEELMLDRIVRYIEYLIEFTQPQKMVYIAVDGVAPAAKVKQQRMRRFKSMKYKRQVNAIKSKYGLDKPDPWNSTAITPGTEFMQKITERLNQYIQTQDLDMIFSSGSTPMEGEHKILQHLKTLDPNWQYVIYGLDADLIFLALASGRSNMYLLREVQHFGKKKEDTELDGESDPEDVYEELCFMDIPLFKTCVSERIGEDLIGLDTDAQIKDFIFLGYFLGNDFIPHLPSIDINRGGLDFLLEAYTNTANQLQGQYLLDANHEINSAFMMELLNYMVRREDAYLRKLYNSNKRARRCFSTDEMEKEIFALDHLQTQDIHDPVQLGKDSPRLWKYRYYEQHFNISSHQYPFIMDVCRSFLEGLYWSAKYYFEECISWSWYYPHNHCPFLSDVLKFYRKNPNFFDNIQLSYDQPLQPFIQLLTVLPPDCAELLPPAYQDLMTSMSSPIMDLYPTHFEEDMVHKDMLWQAIPLLPNLNIPRIQSAANELRYRISDEDWERNQNQNIYTNIV